MMSGSGSKDITDRLIAEVKKMPMERQQSLLDELSESKPAANANKRQYARKNCNITAGYTCGRTSGRQRIRDISLGGVFIETAEKFEVGQLITLSIPFSNKDIHLKVTGRVVRITSAGIGVQFDKSAIDIG